MEINNNDNKKIYSSYQDFVNSQANFPVHPSTHRFNKTVKVYFQTNKQYSAHQTQRGHERNNEEYLKKSSQGMQKGQKKFTITAEKIYQSKKNAYKNYIKEIYNKINEELKKKNTFLTIATQNLKQIDYTLSLTTKQVKPIKIQKEQSQQKQESNLKKKLREKLKLEKLQEESASIEKIRQKIVILKKEEEKQKKLLALKKQQIDLSKTQRQFRQQKELIAKQLSADHHSKRQFFKQKRRQRINSLNTALNGLSTKINAQDFILNRFLFNKKDPFVCGLNQKQSAQQKNKQKILNYLDFLWKINYSNNIFIKSQPQEVTYKAYVGSGNNSIMVKSILKRRFWWTVVDKPQGANFIWTQLKINSIFKEHQSTSKALKQNIYHIRHTDIANLLKSNNTTEYDQQDPHERIFNTIDLYFWNEHSLKNAKNEIVINERTYLKRIDLLTRKNIVRKEDNYKITMHNHLQENYFIGNKKALFYNMRKYYQLKETNVFQSLPLTFHIVKGIEDPQYKNFVSYYNQLQELKKKGEDEKNIWILKPGEFSNRGNGISVCHSLDDILLRLKSKQKSSDGNLRTFIIQKYIEKPLLYKSRKFDIRHYMLITCFNGLFKAYWYPEGYIRTSSTAFTLKRGNNLFVHLTNDAIQKNSDQYGKYQKGNKISYQKFQNYLDKNIKNSNDKNLFFDKILPQMKQLTVNAIKSTYFMLDSKRRQHNFQLLGMDFMIDQNLKPWLIQINTNPCLQLSCPLLSKLIPAVVENTFKLCIDPFFPPPAQWNNNRKFTLSDNVLEDNRFELIFDESISGRQIQQLYKGNLVPQSNIGKIQQDAQIYENDGIQQWQAQQKKQNQ